MLYKCNLAQESRGEAIRTMLAVSRTDSEDPIMGKSVTTEVTDPLVVWKDAMNELVLANRERVIASIAQCCAKLLIMIDSNQPPIDLGTIETADVLVGVAMAQNSITLTSLLEQSYLPTCQDLRN